VIVSLAGNADVLVDALSFAFGMFWEILWALILGFALSGAVQALVSKQEMRRLLPDDSPRSLALAAGLGAASSSCSYAAVALARRLYRHRRLLRGGLGRDLDRHRPRPADRRRARRLGARLLVAGDLLREPPDLRQVLGTCDRAARRDRQLRLLDRQRAARGRALERRHQLRRRARLHIRRPDRPPDP